MTEPSPRPAVRKRLAWRPATVANASFESQSARTLGIALGAEAGPWDGHRAGQHVDLRLTADDGYQATRSYSVSSGPGEPLQITVERLQGGEVSPYLVDEVATGDHIEIRGPIGGYFVWDPAPTPLLLLAGGSGIAPLRSIWRAGTTRGAPIQIGASFRGADSIIFEQELTEFGASIHLTREASDRYEAGRVGVGAIEQLWGRLGRTAEERATATVFVCGPTSFVEAMATNLRAIGVDGAAMRLERFG